MMRPRGGFTSYVGYGALTLILMYVLFLYNATKNGLNSCEETGLKLKDDKKELISHLSVAQEHTKRMKTTVNDLGAAQKRCNEDKQQLQSEVESFRKEISDLKTSLKNKESELSNSELDARNLRTELQENKEDCARVREQSYQEYATLQKEKEQIENSLRADLAKKVAEIQKLQDEVTSLKQQAVVQNQAVQPRQQAALAGLGGQPPIPGQGGLAAFPAQGGQPPIPGQGGQGALPGQGGQGALPGQGGQGTLLGQGGQGALPGQGGQGALPGQGGQGALPYQDGLINKDLQNVQNNALPSNNNNPALPAVNNGQVVKEDTIANQVNEANGGAADTNINAQGNNNLPVARSDSKPVGAASNEQLAGEARKPLGGADKVAAFNSPTKGGLLGNIVRRAADGQKPEDTGRNLDGDPAVVVDEVHRTEAQGIGHMPDRYGGVKKGEELPKDTNVVQRPLGIMGDDSMNNSREDQLDEDLLHE